MGLLDSGLLLMLLGIRGLRLISPKMDTLAMTLTQKRLAPGIIAIILRVANGSQQRINQ